MFIIFISELYSYIRRNIYQGHFYGGLGEGGILGVKHIISASFIQKINIYLTANR